MCLQRATWVEGLEVCAQESHRGRLPLWPCSSGWGEWRRQLPETQMVPFILIFCSLPWAWGWENFRRLRLLPRIEAGEERLSLYLVKRKEAKLQSQVWHSPQGKGALGEGVVL